MYSHLVSCVSYRRHLFWEGIETMTRDKPGRLDTHLLEQLQEAGRSDLPCEHTLQSAIGLGARAIVSASDMVAMTSKQQLKRTAKQDGGDGSS